MRTPTNDSTIATRGLSKHFPLHAGWKGLWSKETRAALTDVTLDVRRGEVFGLLGPNGAGKTTLMKILATLVLPSSGAAFVHGLDVAHHSTQVRRLLGVVYGDERSFFWRLSVRENLLFYAALYRLTGKEAGRKVDELIEMVGLGEAANVRMHSYSTGMKQRAAIARGLLGDPEIIFMDEPTRSLDPVGTHEIHRIIRERLQADGHHTILLATNNMDEAEELCDRVALLNRGAVQKMGTILELQSSFAGARIHHIAASSATCEEVRQIERVPGVQAAAITSQGGDRTIITVHVEPRSDAIPEALRVLIRNGVDVWSCTEEVTTLDDMFRWTVQEIRTREEALA